MRTILIWLILTLPVVAAAQEAPSKAATAADRFALDLPAADPAPTPPSATDQAPPVAAEPVPVPPASVATPVATPGTFSLDTPIADLVADVRAKAVLDRNLPGLSDDENLPKFQALSLRKFAPLTGGQLTPALLQQTAIDLASLAAGGAPSRPGAKKVPIGR